MNFIRSRNFAKQPSQQEQQSTGELIRKSLRFYERRPRVNDRCPPLQDYEERKEAQELP